MSCVLDIAILCERSNIHSEDARSSAYTYFQRILSTLYKLGCYICAAEDGGRQNSKNADFRILLVCNDNDAINHKAQDNRMLLSQGPLISLKVLARSIRSWSTVYAIEGEPGEALLRHFTESRRPLSLQRPTMIWETRRVIGGTSIKISGIESKSKETTGSGKKHCSVALGGTFDHLHAGHKLLLTAAALILQPVSDSSESGGRCLTVGITGDELLKTKKYAEFLESWDERQRAVIHFLSAMMDFDSSGDGLEVERVMDEGPNGKAMNCKMNGNLTIRCVEISDPFGPTITDEAISALVISGETRSGGKAVNDKRAEKDWPLLEVFEVDVLDASTDKEVDATEAEGFQSKISSTEIRRQLHERQTRGLHL